MMKSIRYKLLAYMTAGIIVFALLLYGANTFFAEDYYIRHKKNILIKSTKQISEILRDVDEPSDFQDDNLIYELSRLEKGIGGTVIIGKGDGTLYYPTPHDSKGQIRKGMIMNPFFIEKDQLTNNAIAKLRKFIRETRSYEVYNDKSYFIITKDPNLKFDTLRLETVLDSGLIASVWLPMTEIAESAEVSNRLTGIIAIITIIITWGWAFYISDKFTKPITLMNSTTKRMADFDFSQKLHVNSQDEIGQLSQSINYLSERLDSSIGELNRRNQQLEIDVDRGKEIDRIRREFVSNVSHELKTPIFLIQGYAEGLKSNVAEGRAKMDFYCDVIMEEAEKMNVIVRDLLNLSQLESDTIQLSRCDFDIEHLVSDVLRKLEPMFAEKGIKVVNDITEEIMVNGDPVRIEQVLINYLNNAINHVDKKGFIRLVAEPHGEKVRLMVYNTGQHIPEESIERIWSSFYKIDKARTREYGGTGLGLAIVKAIQTAHNNQCGVSNMNDGVEFWFELDKAQKRERS